LAIGRLEEEKMTRGGFATSITYEGPRKGLVIINIDESR